MWGGGFLASRLKRSGKERVFRTFDRAKSIIDPKLDEESR